MQPENNKVLNTLTPDVEFAWAYWLDVPSDEFAWSDVELYQKILLYLGKQKANTKYSVQADQNRDKYFYYSCTIHASVGALCDLLGYWYDVYIKLIKEVTDRMYKDGKYSPTKGAYTAIAMEYTEKVHNEMYPNNKVYKFKTTIGTGLFNLLLAKRYSLVVTYISSKAYAQDAKDGTLDANEFAWSTGWHCIRWSNKEEIKYANQNCEYITALDNYFINKANPDLGYKHYRVPRKLDNWDSNILELVQSRWGVYYDSAYFFMKESDLTAIWLAV